MDRILELMGKTNEPIYLSWFFSRYRQIVMRFDIDPSVLPHLQVHQYCIIISALDMEEAFKPADFLKAQPFV